MTADYVFLNGEVLTVDSDDSVKEAVAVKDCIILDTGSNEDIHKYISDQTQIIDLEGKTLMPGFIDSHAHLTIYGTNLLGVSCKDSGMRSLSDLFTLLRRKIDQTPAGSWIRASEFKEANFAENRYPSLKELDELSEHHPIVIVRTCNHTSIANSKALEIAGITTDTPNPEGGLIERDENGNLTGKLLENAHMQLFKHAAFTSDELKIAMTLASDAFIKAGITSMHDAGGYGNGAETLRVMQQAVKNKDIKIRVTAMIGSLTDSHLFVEKLLQAGLVTGLGDKWFRIGPAKVFTDGSSVGPTVAVREPYSHDHSNFGILYYTQEELNKILGAAHKKGFQITAHAQGDKAIEMLLHCFEEALKKHPRENHRHRIEHGGIAPADLQERIRKLGVIVTPNPVFMYVNGEVYQQYYGERVEVMYPMRDYFDKGIIAAIGSDAPVTFIHPLLGIHAAVNRTTDQGNPVGTSQSISVKEAVRAYTLNGAYASFEEKIKGSIEKGKLADLTVLSDSLLKSKIADIKNLTTIMTMIDGEVLYHSDMIHPKSAQILFD